MLQGLVLQGIDPEYGFTASSTYVRGAGVPLAFRWAGESGTGFLVGWVICWHHRAPEGLACS